jgi:putative ABC transport system permease protein
MAAPNQLTFLGLTGRDIVRQPVRTGLTVVGVALGVIAIVAFSATARGLNTQMEDAIKTGGADMMVYESNVAADILSRLEEDAVGDRIRAIPGVAEVAGGLIHVLPVEELSYMLLFGIREDEFIMQSSAARSGRKLTSQDEIMLGAGAARRLKKGVGDALEIQGEPFEIVGIFQTDITFFNSGIVIHLAKLQELIGSRGQVSTFMVKVTEDADLTAVRETIEQDENLVTITNAAEYARVDRGLEVAEGMVWAISLLAVFVGSIIVMNTMWMSVHERTREIGVLRAIGWSKPRVMLMIVIETVFLGLIACVVGIVLGVGLAEAVRFLPVVAQFISPTYEWPTFVLAVNVAVVLSLVGAAAPVWRATRISPAEALRYE